MSGSRERATRTTIRAAMLIATSLLLAACDIEVATNKGGVVTSHPAGINCGTGVPSTQRVCTISSYEKLKSAYGSLGEIRFTATPLDNYRLSHWSGCDRTERLHCFKKTGSDIVVTATFAPITLASDPASSEVLRFVAIGDVGTGKNGQLRVASAVKQICDSATNPCSFAVGLGDNLYEQNVLSPYSSVFDSHFVAPYQKLGFPFYMALGNHDSDLLIDGFGNFTAVGDTQVAYSDVNPQWKMPGRHYQHSHPEGSGTPIATFLALDSTPLMTIIDPSIAYWPQYDLKQGKWAREALAASNATWKFAYAHHPYLSNGWHGNAGSYDGFTPLFYRLSGEYYRNWLQNNICGKVDVFFAGHDHDLQLLHSVPECGNTLFVVSGAGGKSNDPDESVGIEEAQYNPAMFYATDTLGFVIVEIRGNELTLQFYKVPTGDTEAASHGLPISTTPVYSRTFKRREMQ
ncbi:MAG: metallophosphoesterase [Alcanivoracaceae bacterium]|nr:metallophosphoesterase [Alcanivoracaceae bacterium]